MPLILMATARFVDHHNKHTPLPANPKSEVIPSEFVKFYKSKIEPLILKDAMEWDAAVAESTAESTAESKVQGNGDNATRAAANIVFGDRLKL